MSLFYSHQVEHIHKNVYYMLLSKKFHVPWELCKWHKMFLLCNKRRNSAFPMSVRKYFENEFIVNRRTLQSSLQAALHPFKHTGASQIKPEPQASHVNWTSGAQCWHRNLGSLWKPVICSPPRGCGHARRGQTITRVLESKKCFTPATRFSAMASDFIKAEISLGWRGLVTAGATPHQASSSSKQFTFKGQHKLLVFLFLR